MVTFKTLEASPLAEDERRSGDGAEGPHTEDTHTEANTEELNF